MLNFLKHEDKKVEYVELIYDLIFVYIIGRNNSFISIITNGFIDPALYFSYVLYTLITIQIWYFTTLFINRYGSNEFSEYVGLFINMFLIYYMADGTSVFWQHTFYRYNIAWMLILVNLIVQYYLKYRLAGQESPWEAAHIRTTILMLGIMVLIIAAGLILFKPLGIPLTPLAMAAGIVLSIVWQGKLNLVTVDFPHLTERVMLYVVFTFGEMIISIAPYFSGKVSLRSLYYSLCAFLIVVGLFMSYGFIYDYLLDREMSISGNSFLTIHIFIIFALSNLTQALSFMQEEAVSLIPKTIYLIASFLVYYIFIYLLIPFTKGYTHGHKTFGQYFIPLAVCLVLIGVFYNMPVIGIGISVIMTFMIWRLEYLYYLRCLVS